MAGIQDPLTDLPPPSRLDFEDLSNFNFGLSPASETPSAFFSWASSSSIEVPLRPRLLFIASSPSGLHLLHHLPGKHFLGSVIVPESNPVPSDPKRFSVDGNEEKPSIYDGRNPKGQPVHASDVYSLDEHQASVIMVAVSTPVPEESASTWARALLDVMSPERVLMVASVQIDHFRGMLSSDDKVVFRLETDCLRLEEQGRVHSDLPYFPSGSLVSGLPAAVLTQCQFIGLKGRLLLLWPEAGPSAPSSLASVLQGFLETTSLDFRPALQVPFKGKSVSDLEIYF